MSLIWATRGRMWGFRFLRNAGFEDPLPVYETAFSEVQDGSEAWRRVARTLALPEMVALRFPDPVGRRDLAGRVIPHDFVIFGALADKVDSVEAGRLRIWPLVADDFERVWEL